MIQKWILIFLIFQVSWVHAQSVMKSKDPKQAFASLASQIALIKNPPKYNSKGPRWNFKPGSQIVVTINNSKILRRITPFNFGVNAAWWDGKKWFLNSQQVLKAQEAGIHFWRWPGGSASDNYFWNGKVLPGGKGIDAQMNDPEFVQTRNFMQFCRETHSQPIFTVNFGLARYGSVQEAAQLAASWVRYCNIQHHWNVQYWEIGNEVYGAWESGNQVAGKAPLNGKEYGHDFNIIVHAMKKIDPHIFVGAVAVNHDNGNTWTGYHWWMKQLLPEIQHSADFLILHQYFLWPYNQAHQYVAPSNKTIFDDWSKVQRSFQSVQQMMKKYIPQTHPLPIALTEFNMINSSPRRTIELINGIFTAGVLGQALVSGYSAVDYWDWKNGLDYKLHGDHGMLSWNDQRIPNSTPRPSYYAFAIYHDAFGNQLIRCRSSNSSVKIYASRFSNGALGLILLNISHHPRQVKFQFSHFKPQGRLMGWVLTGNRLRSRRVTWNGHPGPQGGGGPFPLKAINPYHLQFHNSKSLKLNLAPISVSGVIIY
jgi:hypothetical protein